MNTDINDLIATNAIHSFNTGYTSGIREQRRILINALADTSISADLIYFAKIAMENESAEVQLDAVKRINELLDLVK